jgi:4-hydroxy-3-polyprenylbenzoate decarboxylase
LLKANVRVFVLLSQASQVVAALETDLNLPGKVDSLEAFLSQRYQAQPGQLIVYGHQDWTAPIASGSAPASAMVVCPCSSGTLSAIAHGSSNNLLERAADVMIKERRPLILVHRETPLSVIHLENMLSLAKQGVTILPANPGFYHQPERASELVDFIVARILDHLQIGHDLLPRWGE